jgi:hypothetical protein
MYAVYVLAAILLSVAPMHATTVLAALPSATRGQRVNATRVVRGERIAAKSSQMSPQPLSFHIAPQTHAVQPKAYASESVLLAILPEANLLAHSPNAP